MRSRLVLAERQHAAPVFRPGDERDRRIARQLGAEVARAPELPGGGVAALLLHAVEHLGQVSVLRHEGRPLATALRQPQWR
jgi:hypothetical protein